MSNYGGMEESIPTNPIDIYHDTCKKFDRVLSYSDQFKAVWEGGSETLKSSYYIMRNGIDKSITNEKIMLTNDEIRTIKSSSDIVYNKCMFGKLDNISRDTVFLLLKIFNNWNINCYKNSEFEKKLEGIDRLYKTELTLIELIDVNRQLIEKMKQIINYIPPSFEHSKAYLKTLCDECG